MPSIASILSLPVGNPTETPRALVPTGGADAFETLLDLGADVLGGKPRENARDERRPIEPIAGPLDSATATADFDRRARIETEGARDIQADRPQRESGEGNPVEDRIRPDAPRAAHEKPQAGTARAQESPATEETQAAPSFPLPEKIAAPEAAAADAVLEAAAEEPVVSRAPHASRASALLAQILAFLQGTRPPITREETPGAAEEQMHPLGTDAVPAAVPQPLPEEASAPVAKSDAAIPAAVPVAPVPLSAEELLAEIRQWLATVRALPLSSETAPTASSPSQEATPIPAALKTDIAAALKLFGRHEAGEIDEQALLRQLKPLAENIRQLIARIAPPAEATAHVSEKPAPALAAPDGIAPSPKSSSAAPETATPQGQPQVTMQTTAATATPVAAASGGGENGLSSGGHNAGNNSQAMPQMVAGIRSAAPSQVPAEAARGAEFARALNQAGRAPVAEQVVFHIKTAVGDGSSRIRIQLEPVELGKLDIRLKVDAEGKTNVTVTADNKGTLDMLQRDARGLERALADAGLKTDTGSLSFNLRGGQGEHGQQETSHAAHRYRQNAPEEEEALPALTRSYVIDLAEGLDIRI